MIVFAIDPGPERSGWVLYDSTSQLVGDCGIADNNDLRVRLFQTRANWLVLEMIASYGMPVGASTFETCVWIGRFLEAWPIKTRMARLYRRDIKLHLCGSPRAKDANVRQALIDRFGGTREKAIGTKKQPGPLYGVKGDVWAALAVAVTWTETR